MKEKRYELIKKGELAHRSPEGINALCEPNHENIGNILENLERYKAGTPRSSLNQEILEKLENSKIHDYNCSERKVYSKKNKKEP